MLSQLIFRILLNKSSSHVHCVFCPNFVMQILQIPWPILICVWISIHQCSADICDLCQCKPDRVTMLIECIGETKNNIPLELENIQWPTGTGNVMAFFEYLNYTYLPKYFFFWKSPLKIYMVYRNLFSVYRVLGSTTVTSIVLNNNQIDTISSDPFQYFPNMLNIAMVKNSLRSLPKGKILLLQNYNRFQRNLK